MVGRSHCGKLVSSYWRQSDNLLIVTSYAPTSIRQGDDDASCLSCHPATHQSTQPAFVRQVYLQKTKPDRAFLQPHQTIQAYGHPLRKTRQVFSILRSSRLCFRWPCLTENRLQHCGKARFSSGSSHTRNTDLHTGIPSKK